MRIVVKSSLDERADFLRTPPTELAKHPEQARIPDLREISFGAPGGPRLAGRYAPSGNRAAVVLVHGTGSDRSAMLIEAQVLNQADFGILCLDLPGQGSSEGRTLWGMPERKAIGAAVDWLRGRPEVDPRRVGVLGHSMGGYIVAQANNGQLSIIRLIGSTS